MLHSVFVGLSAYAAPTSTLSIGSAHYYSSSFTVGPEPVDSVNCAGVLVEPASNITLTHNFAGAAGGAVWEYSSLILMLEGDVSVMSKVFLNMTGVHVEDNYLLSVSATDEAPADKLSFFDGSHHDGQRACPCGHCLIADPGLDRASMPPCKFAPKPTSAVQQPVSKYAPALLIDVTSLVKPVASKILKLAIFPEAIQSSGAWGAELTIQGLTISVQ